MVGARAKEIAGFCFFFRSPKSVRRARLDKKNMMKVFKCVATFAQTVGAAGKATKWKSRNDA